jgi:methyl-accepting chemotaxis protein
MNAGFLTLDDIRHRATRVFVILCWVHVALALAVAQIARNPVLTPAALAAAAAVVATVAAWRLRDGVLLRSVIAICLTFGPIVFVYAGRGHTGGLSGTEDWQIDYHMYFFAVFAMLVAYFDWRPIAVSAALTAVHHLLLDLIVPANVFPEEGLDRVVLHALAVVAECSVLFWITYEVNALFKRVEDANALVELTAAQTAEALGQQMAENAALRQRLERSVAA